MLSLRPDLTIVAGRRGRRDLPPGVLLPWPQAAVQQPFVASRWCSVGTRVSAFAAERTFTVTMTGKAKLVCWIFPHNGVEPVTIEGATVRWSHAQEFGLAFTQLPPNVERQIARLCANPA